MGSRMCGRGEATALRLRLTVKCGGADYRLIDFVADVFKAALYKVGVELVVSVVTVATVT